MDWHGPARFLMLGPKGHLGNRCDDRNASSRAMIKKRKPPQKNIAGARLVTALLRWYDRGHRSFVWRAATGDAPDPYRVWLGEVMLQQTQAATVESYFRKFLDRWPTLQDLARADQDALLHVWQGLGYYSRARNLLRTAKIVAGEMGGRFPEEEAGLLALPGIGPYSAAAIAAIAFEKQATVVDGNVERVIARLFAIVDPLPKAKKQIRACAETLTPKRRPGDYAHAIMELGGTLCRPVRPDCSHCPWAFACEAHARGLEGELPKRVRRPPRPTRHGVAFWLRRGDGAVLLRRRTEKGLLGGMMEFPSTEWRQAAWTMEEAWPQAPVPAAKLVRRELLPGCVRHEFSHFRLELRIVMADVVAKTRGRVPTPKDAVWCLPDQFDEHALPSAMRKVIGHVAAHVAACGDDAARS